MAPVKKPPAESTLDTILGRVSRGVVVLIVLPLIFFLATEGLRSYTALVQTANSNSAKISALNESVSNMNSRLARLESLIDRRIGGVFPPLESLTMLRERASTQYDGEGDEHDHQVPADPRIGLVPRFNNDWRLR